MYRDCAFCGAALRANSRLTSVPIGRHVVIDPSRDRAWVICDACGRWNLAPEDERSGIVVECEALLGDVIAKDVNGEVVRVSQGGVSITRVGARESKDLALWRYGARIAHRTRRLSTIAYASLALPPALAVAATAFGAPALALPMFGAAAAAAIGNRWRLRRRTLLVVVDDAGLTRSISAREVAAAELVRSAATGGWVVRLHAGAVPIEVNGVDAARIVRSALAMRSPDASPETFADAVALLSDPAVKHVGDLFSLAAHEVPRVQSNGGIWGTIIPGSIVDLPAAMRIALEIATTQLLERDDLDEGRRATLDAWRMATIIADIADNLLLPAEVQSRLARLKERSVEP
jgi:hypothetical protein